MAVKCQDCENIPSLGRKWCDECDTRCRKERWLARSTLMKERRKLWAESGLIDLNEAAKIIKCNHGIAYALLRQGRLEGKMIQGRWMVKPKSVEAMAKERTRVKNSILSRKRIAAYKKHQKLKRKAAISGG